LYCLLKVTDAGEICVTKRFPICTSHQVSFECSNHGWDGRGMPHVWRKTKCIWSFGGETWGKEETGKT